MAFFFPLYSTAAIQRQRPFQLKLIELHLAIEEKEQKTTARKKATITGALFLKQLTTECQHGRKKRKRESKKTTRKTANTSGKWEKFQNK